MQNYFFRAFPALRHTNYRFWVAGQLTSLIGTWIQMVAQGWLVLQLTDSAMWVGIIAALNALPVLFFTLFGGVIVDRFSKKKVLFIAEFSAMLLAFILGILVILQVVTVLHIAILAFLLGVVNAVDMPARLAFASEIVDKEDLGSALALNAGMFNTARIIGPGIAGYLIASVGIGGGFIANGFSFLAVLGALFFIRATPHIADSHSHPIRAVQEGISYSLSHSLIKNLLIFAGLLAVFGWSYIVIMPVIVKDVFHLGAAELGYFNAVGGLGALVGAVFVSAFSKYVESWKLILGGGFIFSFSLLLFSVTTFIPLALLALFGLGLGLILQFATINTTIQHNVEDGFRGRVMSIYAFMFQGMTPFGSMQIGILAEYFGSQIALRTSGIIVLFLCLYYLYHKETLPKPQ